MKTTTKWLIGALAVLAMGVVALVLGVLSWLPFQRQVDEVPQAPTPEPTPAAAIPDGDWFGLVTVGRDESGTITLGVDLAKMLNGHAAHDAAVKAGVIGEDEDLPNDFFIENPESVMELMHLADGALISVISASDVSQELAVDAEDLEALYEGTYMGSDVYGIVPGQPIVMNLSVRGGLITEMSAVYLP